MARGEEVAAYAFLGQSFCEGWEGGTRLCACQVEGVCQTFPHPLFFSGQALPKPMTRDGEEATCFSQAELLRDMNAVLCASGLGGGFQALCFGVGVPGFPAPVCSQPYSRS